MTDPESAAARLQALQDLVRPDLTTLFQCVQGPFADTRNPFVVALDEVGNVDLADLPTVATFALRNIQVLYALTAPNTELDDDALLMSAATGLAAQLSLLAGGARAGRYQVGMPLGTYRAQVVPSLEKARTLLEDAAGRHRRTGPGNRPIRRPTTQPRRPKPLELIRLARVLDTAAAAIRSELRLAGLSVVLELSSIAPKVDEWVVRDGPGDDRIPLYGGRAVRSEIDLADSRQLFAALLLRKLGLLGVLVDAQVATPARLLLPCLAEVGGGLQKLADALRAQPGRQSGRTGRSVSDVLAAAAADCFSAAKATMQVLVIDNRLDAEVLLVGEPPEETP